MDSASSNRLCGGRVAHRAIRQTQGADQGLKRDRAPAPAPVGGRCGGALWGSALDD